jgi:hypothetical protein
MKKGKQPGKRSQTIISDDEEGEKNEERNKHIIKTIFIIQTYIHIYY